MVQSRRRVDVCLEDRNIRNVAETRFNLEAKNIS